VNERLVNLNFRARLALAKGIKALAEDRGVAYADLLREWAEAGYKAAKAGLELAAASGRGGTDVTEEEMTKALDKFSEEVVKPLFERMEKRLDRAERINEALLRKLGFDVQIDSDPPSKPAKSK
jgi:hypothetical protein